MSIKHSLEEKMVTRLLQMRKQIKANLPNRAINNIDLLISHLQVNIVKNQRREIVYGFFFEGGKIKISDIDGKMPLEKWVKELKFADKQRIRVIVESIGKVGI